MSAGSTEPTSAAAMNTRPWRLPRTGTSEAKTRPRQKYAKLSYAGRRTASFPPDN